jgi:hypothetical protein
MHQGIPRYALVLKWLLKRIRYPLETILEQ